MTFPEKIYEVTTAGNVWQLTYGLPFLQDVEFLQWHFIALASALEIGTIVAVYLWRKRRRKADVIDENL